MSSINRLNQKFGRWEIIGKSTDRDGIECYLCRCECGLEREIAYKDLAEGNTLSCGGTHLPAPSGKRDHSGVNLSLGV
jgi:hypothetical protein